MVYLITGASHTGKTALAQKLLLKHNCPYLSVDHLKMGLIRSGQTELTPLSPDAELTAYLWPIVREMIKTAIENRQSLIVEGCYIPADWATDFSAEYLKEIRFLCLILSEGYIKTHFSDIVTYANVIESRIADDVTADELLKDNATWLFLAKKHGLSYLLIEDDYETTIKKATD